MKAGHRYRIARSQFSTSQHIVRRSPWRRSDGRRGFGLAALGTRPALGPDDDLARGLPSLHRLVAYSQFLRRSSMTGWGM